MKKEKEYKVTYRERGNTYAPVKKMVIAARNIDRAKDYAVSKIGDKYIIVSAKLIKDNTGADNAELEKLIRYCKKVNAVIRTYYKRDTISSAIVTLENGKDVVLKHIKNRWTL